MGKSSHSSNKKTQKNKKTSRQTLKMTKTSRTKNAFAKTRLTKSLRRSNKNKNKKRVFNAADYNSGDGMVTSVWGPAKWHTLHTESFNYPVSPSKQQMKDYRNALLLLRSTLPCGKCRTNLTKNFEKLPPDWKHFKSRDTYSRYIYNLHELVNKMLHKRSTLSFEDVRERYENFRSRCTLDSATAKQLTHHDSTCMKTCYCKTRKHNSQKSKKRPKENGCTEALYGKKSKCIIKIVPFEHSPTEPTLQVNRQCLKRR